MDREQTDSYQREETKGLSETGEGIKQKTNKQTNKQSPRRPRQPQSDHQ